MLHHAHILRFQDTIDDIGGLNALLVLESSSGYLDGTGSTVDLVWVVYDRAESVFLV